MPCLEPSISSRHWLWSAAAAGLLALSLRAAPLNATLFDQPWRLLLVLAAGLWLALARWAAPARRLARRLLLETPFRSFRFLLVAAGTLLYATLTWVVFDGLPVLDDDVSALMQARIFATGRLTLPLPSLPDFFWIHCWLGSPQGLAHMCSMYPPGHPLLLLPGQLAGVPWLVTPLFGGGLGAVTAAAGRELFGDKTGRLAGLLALFSPFVMELSATHLSHIPTAFFLTFALLHVARLIRRGGGWRHGWWAGFGVGMAFLCRPLTAVMVGTVLALAPLWHWRRALRAWRPALLAAGLVLLAVALYLCYTDIITGDWRVQGHTLGLGRRGKFGFVKLDWVRTHTPALGWRYTLERLGAINAKLLGWPLPAMLAALAPALLRRADRRDLWLLMMPLSLLGVYMGFWYIESEFPARYIFCGMPMLLILSARGLLMVSRRAGAPVHALLTPLLLCNVALFAPTHFAAFKPNHWDVENLLPRVLEETGISKAVLFMDSYGVLPQRQDFANDFYATGFMRNNLTFDGDIVFARNLRTNNWRLAQMYPDRDYYLYRYHREHHRIVLYRLTFDGHEQILTPLGGRSDLFRAPDGDNGRTSASPSPAGGGSAP